MNFVGDGAQYRLLVALMRDRFPDLPWDEATVSRAPKPSQVNVWALGSSETRRALLEQHPACTWHTVALSRWTLCVRVGSGSVIMPHVTLEPGCQVGRHCLINANTYIHHDCVIGDHVTIGPSCVLLGGVRVKDNVTIGAGTIVREQRVIRATVGMGSVVVADVEEKQPSWGNPARYQAWCWTKKVDYELLRALLIQSEADGRLTNFGVLVQRLEREAVHRLRIVKHQVLSVANATVGLHLLLQHRLEAGLNMNGGVLASPFGFPSIVQGPFVRHLRQAGMDPTHGGPVLPPDDEDPPAVVLLTNPFGYLVDIAFYRQYCDRLGIPLWMDNAAAPRSLFRGQNVCDWADAAVISLHETKPLGRGEGGLVLAPDVSALRRLTNFGFSDDRTQFSANGSNYKMSEFSAAAILVHWNTSWDRIVSFMLQHPVRDHVGPFRAPEAGSVMGCRMEPRRCRANMDVKHYYRPLWPCEVAERFFQSHQCVPHHD